MKCPHCGKDSNIPPRYYELQTTPLYGNNNIFHNRFFTEYELAQPVNVQYIRNLKAGLLNSRFVHLKRISKSKYSKYTGI